MKFRCKIGLHKWKYTGSSLLTMSSDYFRTCMNCQKKQKGIKNNNWANSGPSIYWATVGPSISLPIAKICNNKITEIK